MSNGNGNGNGNGNVIGVKAYQKKCTRCSRQILMSPTPLNGGTKWQALEVESKELHKCITASAKVSEITPTTTETTRNINPSAAAHANEQEITALKARLAKVEDWIKKVSESCTFNHV